MQCQTFFSEKTDFDTLRPTGAREPSTVSIIRFYQMYISAVPPLASSQNEDYLAIFLARYRVLAPDNVQPGAKWRRSSEWTRLRGDFYWKMEEILHFDTAQTLSQFVL